MATGLEEEIDMAAAVPEAWVVTTTSDDGPYQIKAAGPFDSFDAADAFRTLAIDGLTAEQAADVAVVALESTDEPAEFVAS
jgi:hypothetical protein